MQIFDMAPGGGRMLWILIFVIVILGGTATLLFVGARQAKFEMSPEGLRIRGNLYGRFIAAAQLRIDEARVVDLASNAELQPKWRTNGVGLPGYSAGWFRLRNGEKALVFLTRRGRAVYIPTNAGYSVLISPDDPDAFLSALQSTIRKA
jgi:hypothetical protein